MAKPLFYVSPNNGYLYRYDTGIWSNIIAATPPNFLDAGGAAGGTSQTGGSHPALFVWRGRLWMMYFTITEGVRYRFVEITGLGGTPAYDTAHIVSVDPSNFGLTDKTKTTFSNIEYYRGMVVRLAWPEDSADMYAVVFDDFDGNGSPEVRIYKVQGFPSAWTSWESGASTGDADPHGGGHLFAHAQSLFWSPRGPFDRSPSKVWERLFKIDIRETAGGVSVVVGAIPAGQAVFPTWDSDTTNPAALSNSNLSGLTNCSLAAGSINGKLFAVRANGVVDVVNELTYARVRAFDLRDSSYHVVASLLTPEALSSGAPAHVRFSQGHLASPGAAIDQLDLCGGRLDIVAGPRIGQKFDIAGMFRNGASPAATSPVEFKLVDPSTGAVATALTAADTCTIRKGFLGSVYDGETALRGAPSTVICKSHGGFAYIISAGRKPTIGDAQVAAPLMVTKWNGDAPGIPSFLLISAAVSVNGLDCTIDEDANLLHIVYFDLETSLVRHAVINLATFSLIEHPSIVALSNPQNIPCGVGPGAAFAFATFEPSADLGGPPVFYPNDRTVRIDYSLWSQMPGGLTNVSFRVEYDKGDGWQAATAHATSGPTDNLPATATGAPNFFIHDLQADVPSYVGPIQYRLTTFIP
jgi:hypothetical protein